MIRTHFPDCKLLEKPCYLARHDPAELQHVMRFPALLVLSLLAATASLAQIPMGSALPTVAVANEAGPDSDMDDPAIWIPPDRARRDRALVVAAAKRGGLRVYDLQGKLVQ